MKNNLIFLALIALFLATQCQQNQKPTTLIDQVNTEIANLQAARKSVNESYGQVTALRTAINNIPENVKADAKSGFSELQRQVETFEMKTQAMLTMYDRVVPTLQQFASDTQNGTLTPEQAQARYDSLTLTFKNYSVGVEGTKRMLNMLSEETKRLGGGAAPNN